MAVFDTMNMFSVHDQQVQQTPSDCCKETLFWIDPATYHNNYNNDNNALLGLFFIVLLLFENIAINCSQVFTNNGDTLFPIIFDLLLAYNANNPKTIWR